MPREQRGPLRPRAANGTFTRNTDNTDLPAKKPTNPRTQLPMPGANSVVLAGGITAGQLNYLTTPPIIQVKKTPPLTTFAKDTRLTIFDI
jgi:hypothetical protein